jgi:hypothetical protein
MVTLSNTKVDKYEDCQKLYKYHYIDRIRPYYTTSALVFGSAVDEALNELLKTRMKKSGEILDYKQLFFGKMQYFNYNKKTFDVKNDDIVKYYKSDYMKELLNNAQLTNLSEYLQENGYETINPIIVMDQLLKAVSTSKLDLVDQKFYDLCCYECLISKGLMMLEAFKTNLLPQIIEVTSIQDKIDIKDNDGNNIIGYVDFIAKLKYGGVYVCDNKTSSKKYSENSVKESQQLSIYSEYLNINKGAYFVLNKKVRKTAIKTCQICGVITNGREKTCKEGGSGKKRCNGDFDIIYKLSIDTQLIKDEISEKFKDVTFDKIDNVLEGINNNKFEKTGVLKKCFFYGNKCPYYTRCFNNKDSLKGLVDLNKVDK